MTKLKLSSFEFFPKRQVLRQRQPRWVSVRTAAKGKRPKRRRVDSIEDITGRSPGEKTKVQEVRVSRYTLFSLF